MEDCHPKEKCGDDQMWSNRLFHHLLSLHPIIHLSIGRTSSSDTVLPLNNEGSFVGRSTLVREIPPRGSRSKVCLGDDGETIGSCMCFVPVTESPALLSLLINADTLDQVRYADSTMRRVCRSGQGLYLSI